MSKIMKKVEGLLRGIKKNVIKNNIKHEDYKNTLINNEQMHHKMKTIRSQRHELGTQLYYTLSIVHKGNDYYDVPNCY